MTDIGTAYKSTNKIFPIPEQPNLTFDTTTSFKQLLIRIGKLQVLCYSKIRLHNYGTIRILWHYFINTKIALDVGTEKMVKQRVWNLEPNLFRT